MNDCAWKHGLDEARSGGAGQAAKGGLYARSTPEYIKGNMFVFK